ncbi:MAG: BMP family ABC transporter substrate-binding protein [Acidimicrobiia bacterium]
MKRHIRLLAFLSVFAMILAACGGAETADTTAGTETTETTEAPTETTAPAEETTTTAATETTEGGEVMSGAICEVTDTGGVDDKSFNQLAWEGAQTVAAEYGWEPVVLESVAETDYEPNINSLIGRGDCNLIVTVGFLLGAATETAANANAEQQFAIVDFAYDEGVITNGNVQGLVFAIDQAAFLAGYIAADQTQTGVVGTFGGINITPVSAFMEGFAQGVNYYNEQKGTDVTVLGWDIEAQDGLFTGNFDSLDDGRAFAENLMAEGADIILPVAGPVGLGSAAAVQDNGSARLIGVDADWTQTAPEFGDVILTSILKRIDVAVADAARAVVDGAVGPLLVSTLESGGVGVADITNPLAENAELAAELEAIAAGIIAGDIVTTSQG